MSGIGVVIILLMLAGGLFISISERRIFNRGLCRKHNGLWRLFAYDSQGGSGYRCKEDCVTWCSWPGSDDGYVMKRP